MYFYLLLEVRSPTYEHILMTKELTKEVILRVAARAFATYGYNGVSIRDIAKSVDINHALIRYHFGNKQDLWLSVCSSLLSKVVAMSESCIFNPDASDIDTEIEKYIKYRVTHFAHNPELIKIYTMELIEGGERYQIIEKMVRLHYINYTKDQLLILQSLGYGVGININDGYFAFPFMFAGRFLHSNFLMDLDGKNLEMEEVINRQTDLIINFIK